MWQFANTARHSNVRTTLSSIHITVCTQHYPADTGIVHTMYLARQSGHKAAQQRCGSVHIQLASTDMNTTLSIRDVALCAQCNQQDSTENYNPPEMQYKIQNTITQQHGAERTTLPSRGTALCAQHRPAEARCFVHNTTQQDTVLSTFTNREATLHTQH